MRSVFITLGSSLLSALAALSIGCGSSSSTSDEDVGTGPDGTRPDGPCTGEGRLTVKVSGLPPGLSAKIELQKDQAPIAVDSDQIVMPSGEYAIHAKGVGTADPLVQTAYRATVSTSKIFLCSEAPAEVDVTYALVPSSGKVWASNVNGSAPVLGFDSGSLARTGSPPATVAADTQGGRGIAFDREGNLWAIGATGEDSTIVRYPAASLAASGPKTPDRKIEFKEGGCSPSGHSLAFDGAGNLWISLQCDRRVARIAANELAGDGRITPAVAVHGLAAPKGIAFDRAGNLWVADDVIRRYDASRLATSPDKADATLSTGIDSEGLAFDSAGDLWSVGGSQINLARLAAADLVAGGERDVTPKTTISLGVTALPEGIAFDEGRGLWLATSLGKFARLSVEQLAVSTTYSSPTMPERIISSADVGSAGSFAIYPAPAGLPLYGTLNTP